jgi:hypothetical protein
VRPARRLAVAALALLALAGLSGCRIGAGSGSARGTLHITGCIGEGDDIDAQEAFDLHPTFFAGEPIDDPTGITETNQIRVRMQRSGANVDDADALIIDITDVATVAARLGEWIEVHAAGDATPASGDQTVGPVRASLLLMHRCARRFPALVPSPLLADTDENFAETGVRSVIRFTKLGDRECVVDDGSVHDCERTDGGAYRVGFGGEIRAEFDFHLVDPRPKYLGADFPALGKGHLVGHVDFTLARGRVAQVFP